MAKAVSGKGKVELLWKIVDGTICEAEIHWFEAHGVGRKDFKIKKVIR